MEKRTTMTLDEAANRHANEGWKTVDGEQTGDINPIKWASFVSGANWQHEQDRKEMLAYGEWARANGERHRGNLQKNNEALFNQFLKEKK